MYSMASWSPSQSDPLTVSYMCQRQSSGCMLPSEAPMPPCAATVCERVGKTLVSTATLRPARASCSDARIPEPPAPTMTTSKRRVATPGVWTAGASISEPPEHLDRPAGTADEPGDGEDVERKSD